MNRINQESLKSYILITLIITSLIQIGILWNYQYQNIPIDAISSFFSSHFIKSHGPAPLEADEYLKPLRIIVSDGVDESHWAIYKNDEVYDSLWNDFKTNYLGKVLSSSPVQSFAQDQWGNLLNSTSFTFEYKTNINFEIFAGLLGVKDLPSNRPTGMYKVMISPWEDVNYNLTVYVMDESKIYKYVLPIRADGLSRDADTKSFGGIIKKLHEAGNLRNYMFIKELINGKFPIQMRPDILCVAKGSKDLQYSSFKNLLVSLPDWITLKGKNDLDTLAQNVLHSERDNYDVSTETNNSSVLRNSNNIFRIYNNGILEYKYLSEPDTLDKGMVYEAFKRAEEFIAMRRDLVSGADINIYLSGISVNKEDKGMYDFTFDYIIGNMPIVFDYDRKDGSGVPLKNAISITADNSRVVNCSWAIRNIIQGKDANPYYLNFGTFWTEFSKQNKTNNVISDIKDIGIGYSIKSETNNNMLPVWIVTSEKNDNFPVELQKK